MPLKTQPAAILRFGIFEVDLRAGELRKKGVRIKLQEQPFQVLTVLLQHPDDVVSREQLRSEIWPSDTFVDFDSGLNTAVNKLREALGDAFESPRFIETVPRRGYRFIAPVTSNNQKGAAAKAMPASHASSKNFTPLVWIAVGSIALIAGLIWHWRPIAIVPRRPIVIGDFANSTGDVVFDGALWEGLSVDLQQSPLLKLVSEERIRQTLRMMGQKTDMRLTPEVAREVCQRTGSSATVDGSISMIGAQYNLILKAVDCTTGDSLASVESQAADKNHVLGALNELASEMRSKLGESVATLRKYNTAVAEATTPSLEALRAYSLGIDSENQADDLDGPLPFFQRAIELDPKFAAAYWALGDAYAYLGETTLSAEYLQKAFALRAGVTEWERLGIEGEYYYLATGDLAKARNTFAVMSKLDPTDSYSHASLADFANMLGQYKQALQEERQSLHLDPLNAYGYRHLALTYLLLDQIDEAATTANEAHNKGMDSGLAAVRYGIAFCRRDNSEIRKQAGEREDKPGEEDLLLALEADTAAYFGHLQKAREFATHAAASAQQAREKEVAAEYLAVAALREALFGNVQLTQGLATIAMQQARGRDMDYAVILAFAYAGDIKRAQILADELAKRYPEDTIVQFNYLPTVRAKLALERSDSRSAVDILARTSPYELGMPAYGVYNWPNLYPIYVRGEAYLALHDGLKAASEFQKILDHRGIVLNEPIGILARLHVGRAFAMAGDSPRAKAAYQDFLDLWKDADPDIPILKQAKAEYANLQ